MARGVNKVILVGNIAVELKGFDTRSNTRMATTRIAADEEWTDKQSGEKRKNTEYVNIVFFGALADIAEKYLGKGDKVYIEGKVQTRKWQDQDGKDRYTTEVVAKELLMLGGKRREGKATEQPRDYANVNEWDD